MAAAEQSADPLALASAAHAGAHALLSVGRFEDALNLGQTAHAWLRAQISADDPAALSIAGMLSLRTSIAAARRQDRSLAAQLLDDADRAAQRLGRDANYWHTSFGPTNVQLHRVATALDLGDIQYVADHGDEVDPTAPPAERAVTHKIDMARALSYLARDDEALAQLLDAESVAPQIVRHSAPARETVKALHRRSRPGSTGGARLAGLAERCRAIQ
jgi:hypothetical protein